MNDIQMIGFSSINGLIFRSPTGFPFRYYCIALSLCLMEADMVCRFYENIDKHVVFYFYSPTSSLVYFDFTLPEYCPANSFRRLARSQVPQRPCYWILTVSTGAKKAIYLHF